MGSGREGKRQKAKVKRQKGRTKGLAVSKSTGRGEEAGTAIT
jgi:hypothetical protein